MWYAILSDGTERETGVEDLSAADEAAEDTDSWCVDYDVPAEYELVWRE